jgi:hypothetical protein
VEKAGEYVLQVKYEEQRPHVSLAAAAAAAARGD